MSFAGDPHPSTDQARVAPPESNLRKRVRTALVGGTLTLAVILASSEIPLYILVFAIIYVAASEITALFGGTKPIIAISALFAATALTLTAGIVIPIPLAALIAVLIGTAGILIRLNKKFPSRTDALALGWLAGPIACAIWLHSESADATRFFSPNLLVLVALPIWLGDTAAYFVGKAIGKTPLAPKISPKKTMEGAAANLITCIASSYLIGLILNQNLPNPIPQTAILGVGLVTGTLGQAGDLLQSALKRSSGIKDSGNFLPGHGGILDRLDSFLFACVPASIILWIYASKSFT
ncbi:hypothetical protein C0431_03230 [bacterium]|nr:hypothetical protein [bacterium]